MLSKHDVEHIANLARIELTEEEIAQFQRELSQVLDYFAMLEGVDTSTISPMLHSSLAANVTRKDGEISGDNNQQSDLCSAFTESERGYCKVEAVFETHNANV